MLLECYRGIPYTLSGIHPILLWLYAPRGGIPCSTNSVQLLHQRVYIEVRNISLCFIKATRYFLVYYWSYKIFPCILLKLQDISLCFTKLYNSPDPSMKCFLDFNIPSEFAAQDHFTDFTKMDSNLHIVPQRLQWFKTKLCRLLYTYRRCFLILTAIYNLYSLA